MTCPSCQTAIPDGSRFCPGCGAPAPQPVAIGNYAEPVGESDNPKEPLRVGDTTVRVEGELVPVVDIELGAQTSVYFEHHILLWKQPQVRLGFMGLQNAGKRFFSGLQIFISTAQGPGNIAMSREAPGQVVALKLRPGEMVDVREHQFLMATNNVGYDFYWQTGLRTSSSRARACSSIASPRAPTRVCCCCTATATSSRNNSARASSSTSSPVRGCGRTRRCGWTPSPYCNPAAAEG